MFFIFHLAYGPDLSRPIHPRRKTRRDCVRLIFVRAWLDLKVAQALFHVYQSRPGGVRHGKAHNLHGLVVRASLAPEVEIHAVHLKLRGDPLAPRHARQPRGRVVAASLEHLDEIRADVRGY